MNRTFFMKASLLLGIVTLCLAQGCPPGTGGTGNSGDTGSDGSGDTGGGAGQIIIEPDDFADGTVLTHVNAAFTMSTAEDDNSIVSLFEVTASDDGMDLAPTGQRVFAHHNIPFFNSTRRLRLDFTHSVQSVQITFGGGTFFSTEIGVLQAFDANGNPLSQYVTQPRGSGKTEVMTVTGSNIAWVVAYAQGDGSFGRLDRLVVGGAN